MGAEKQRCDGEMQRRGCLATQERGGPEGGWSVRTNGMLVSEVAGSHGLPSRLGAGASRRGQAGTAHTVCSREG